MTFVHNPDFADGLAGSVKAGIAAVPDNADGAMVCLGDMPLIDAQLIDRLIEAFAPDRGNLIVVPVSDGRRGNPVLWSRRFFNELMTLDGDIGARHLIAKHARGRGGSAGRRPRRLPRYRHAAGAGNRARIVRDILSRVGWAKRKACPPSSMRGSNGGHARKRAFAAPYTPHLQSPVHQVETPAG